MLIGPRVFHHRAAQGLQFFVTNFHTSGGKDPNPNSGNPCLEKAHVSMHQCLLRRGR